MYYQDVVEEREGVEKGLQSVGSSNEKQNPHLFIEVFLV